MVVRTCSRITPLDKNTHLVISFAQTVTDALFNSVIWNMRHRVVSVPIMPKCFCTKHHKQASRTVVLTPLTSGSGALVVHLENLQECRLFKSVNTHSPKWHLLKSKHL